MKAICYISNIVGDPKKDTIKELIDFVKENNTKHEITGILILKNKHFFQILEGEPERIDRLFNKIKIDPRHKNIIILLDTNIEGRIFNDYNGGKFEIFQEHADMKKLYLYLSWIKNAEYIPADELIELTTNFLKHNK